LNPRTLHHAFIVTKASASNQTVDALDLSFQLLAVGFFIRCQFSITSVGERIIVQLIQLFLKNLPMRFQQLRLSAPAEPVPAILGSSSVSPGVLE
jgi:hypothetical protein